jgi:hypothetical protein
MSKRRNIQEGITSFSLCACSLNFLFNLGVAICSVLGKVKDFLGEMAKANEKLQLDAQVGF